MIGGGMANTFLAAQGLNVGASLHEKDLLVTAQKIMTEAGKAKCEIMLPQDGIVTKAFAAEAPHRVSNLHDIAPDEMILDIGPQTMAALENKLKTIKTLVWNGPFGAFELKPFDQGTNRVASAAANLTKAKALISVAGGGDTVAALNQAGASEAFTYVSTAGGAFLEWLEGKTLPGVAALMTNNAQQQVRA
jgi:phosphoglycerate kinase